MKKYILSRRTCLLPLSACSKDEKASEDTKEKEQPAKAEKSIDDGSFEEVATGHNCDIKLSVTFKDNKIEKIDVVESSETPTIADTGFKEIINRILEHQNL